MGIKQDIETSLTDWPVNKIEGQPTEETISKLKTEQKSPNCVHLYPQQMEEANTDTRA
jgi:hypothetical protein